MKVIYFPKLNIDEVKPDYINRGWDSKRKQIEEGIISSGLFESVKNEGLRDPMLGCVQDYRRDKKYFWQLTAGEQRWMCLKKLSIEEARYILRFHEWHKNQDISKRLLDKYEHKEITIDSALDLCGTPGPKVPTKVILGRWRRLLNGR